MTSRYSLLKIFFGVVCLLVLSIGPAQAVYLYPPSWNPMTMLDIDYGTFAAGKLTVATTTVVPVLTIPDYVPADTWTWYGNPSQAFDPGAPYEAGQPWSLLNGKVASRRFGWNDPLNYGEVLPKIVARYQSAAVPDPGVWIERLSQSPGLESYLAVGDCGVNADDSCTVDPANPSGMPYSGIFGSTGSSTKWRWDGLMDHNTYAVPFAAITVPNQPFSATYRIYVGDGAGNDIDPAAATTTTWYWQGPNQVIGPVSFNPAALTVGGTATVSASATSGLAVSFSTLTPLVCSVSGTTVTGLASGTCTIVADQAGRTAAPYFDRAPRVSASLEISAIAAATVTLENLIHTYDGTSKSAKVTTTPSGLGVSVTYDGSATAPTNAGSYAVVATVTDPGYSGSGAGTLTIAPAAPVITWAVPAAIPYGTALSDTQLNAVATVPGTYEYSPVSGAILAAGTQTLSVVFTPADAANYTSAGATVSLTVNPAEYVLDVILLGDGSGSVNSVPSGIHCVSGSASECSAAFTGGVEVALTAAASTGSLFGGWDGLCVGVSSATCKITPSQTGTITATFNVVPPVLMNGEFYPSLPLAYGAAPDNAIIMLKQGTLTGGFSADRTLTVTVRGGYDPAYSTSTGRTTLQGGVTLKQGRVIFDKVAIR